jgi:hypothetical protein
MFSIAPEWYVNAKNAGVSSEVLGQMVRAFCFESLKRKGVVETIDDVEDSLVEVTQSMYEQAFTISMGDEL